jgi:hypothetical protein
MSPKALTTREVCQWEDSCESYARHTLLTGSLPSRTYEMISMSRWEWVGKPDPESTLRSMGDPSADKGPNPHRTVAPGSNPYDVM